MGEPEGFIKKISTPVTASFGCARRRNMIGAEVPNDPGLQHPPRRLENTRKPS